MRRWPENIREHTGALRHALSFAKNDTINEADLPADQGPRMVPRPRALASNLDPDQPTPQALLESDPAPAGLDAHESQLRSRIVALLQGHQGNVTRVAHLLARTEPICTRF